MRSGVAVVLGAWLAISAVEAAEKKGKEIPTQICKRGKLIFEDDFSEKEILWSFNEKTCRWKIVQGRLVSKCAKGDLIFLQRSIAATNGYVLEVTSYSPEASFWFYMRPTDIIGIVSPNGIMRIVKEVRGEDQKPKLETLATTPIPKGNKRPYPMVFEVFQGQVSLSALGQTVTYDTKTPDFQGDLIQINFAVPEGSFVALDDVKFYEAVPKDDEPEKDEKDKKKR